VKVRVAIPAANPPDNAIDLTSRRSVARLICGPQKNLMSQCKGLDVPTNTRQSVWATALDQVETMARMSALGSHRREAGVTHG
jgi:hypothetical protein